MADTKRHNRSTQYHRGLHVLAWLTAAATFPLIFMGGLVTSHQAGLSVPDWPNSYGYNMFTFPPSQWVGGIFYEHTHRLLGTLVGMLAIALAVWAYFREKRRAVRWLAYSVLIGVSMQGVLGGLRVLLVDIDLAVIHGCIAHAFFCLAILTTMTMSRWWVQRPAGPLRLWSGTALLGVIAVAMVFAQLVCGAIMRHYQAGLAIPDLPLAYGRLLPPMNSDGLERINAWRAWHAELKLEQVTLLQVWIHFAHRIGAIVVAAVVTALTVRVLRRHRSEPLLVRQAWMLAYALVAQFTLGVLVVLLAKPADIASYHVATGAILLACAFVVTVRAARLAGGVADNAREVRRRAEAVAA